MASKKEKSNLSRHDGPSSKRMSLLTVEGESEAAAGKGDGVGRPVVSEVQDMDHILTVLGSGPWNIAIWVICSFAYMVVPSNVFWGAYVSPAVNHTCIPPEGLLAADECTYYTSGNNGSVQACSQWEYDTSVFTLTATSQFNMVCERGYMRALVSSIYMTGSGFGAPLGGYFTDRFGRKSTCIVSFALYGVVSITINWVTSINGILAMRFFTGFLHPILLGSAISLVLEVCESRNRSMVGIFNGIPWSVAMMMYGLMAYWIRDWRWLQFSMALQAVVLFPFMIWLLDESPRWLAVQGRHDEALVILTKAQKMNVTKLPPEPALRDIMWRTQQLKVSFSTENDSKLAQCGREVGVLLNKVIRTRVLIMWFLFVVSTMVYYGLSMSAVSLNVDPFVYMVLSGLMEMPSYSFTAPIISKFGRRMPTALGYSLCGVVVFALTFTPKDIEWLLITLAMIGKFSISVAFQILFLYVMELLPTEIRSTGLGSCMLVSRIGSITTPFIMDTLGVVVPWAPPVLFSVCSLGAAGCTLWLPETLDTPMFDTLAAMKEYEDQIRYDGIPKKNKRLSIVSARSSVHVSLQRIPSAL